MNASASASVTTQFNDLPDELVEVMMNYGIPIFDRRSRTLAQERVRDLLVAHRHVSLVTERLMEKVQCISNSFLQCYTFQLMLRQCLSSEQLEEIEQSPPVARIRLMGLRAQENHDYILAKMAEEINPCQSCSSSYEQLANCLRLHLQTWDEQDELDLESSNIISLPDELMQLTSLQTLNLYNNQLTSIPDNLGYWLTNLLHLLLNCNHLTSIPDSLGHLDRLETLDLCGNRLTTVPDSLGQLNSLETLDLIGNQLTYVPDSLGQLTNLRYLKLDGNQLASVPDSLGQLKNLRELSLNDNRLTFVPDSLGQLIRLRKLGLGINQLTYVPASLEHLTQLRKLYICHNQLTYVPDNLGQLISLRHLDISDNQLSYVPASLGQLIGLRRLDLDDNQMTSIPASLGQLKNLTSLNLSYNQLTHIPDSLEHLQLKVLNLDHNQLAIRVCCLI